MTALIIAFILGFILGAGALMAIAAKQVLDDYMEIERRCKYERKRSNSRYGKIHRRKN